MSAKANLRKEKLVLSKGNVQVVLDFGKLRRASLTLRALNHPLRKTMLAMMEEKRKITVTEIYDAMDLEQSVTSQHLAIMRKAEVVTTVREGKFIFYSVNTKRIEEIIKMLDDLAQPE